MKSFQLIKLVKVASAALVFLVVTGCGGGGGDEAPVVEQPATTPQAAEQQPAQQPEQQPAEREQPAVVRESETSEYGFYTIQLSSWRTRSKAEAQVRHYQEMGLEAYVQRTEIPEMGTWFRVRVGKYPALSEAKAAAAALVNIRQNQLWLDNYSSGDPPL
jgi:cell division septation protein DedD